jgi:iron complex outermembrane receptor protein
LHNKVRLLASSAVLFAIAFGTSAAHAQAKPVTTAAADAGAGATIEELVVTAEKRSQSLQDVPVAISAFTSANRDLVGINSIQDMTNFTPGLNYSASNDRNSIRGVGRLTNSHPIANAVALYDDGVYSSSTVPAGKTPIFTDRVEVLRGPQGTLYGRNSIGGAINVISKRPTEDPYAEVRATYGNYDHSTLEAAISGPLAPDLQYRLVGSWDKQDQGYFKNVVPGGSSEGNVVDDWFVEGQLQAKVFDKLDLWGKVDLVGWNNGGGQGPTGRNTFTTAQFNPSEFGTFAPNAGFACAPGGVVSNVVNASPLGCVNPASKNPRDFASNINESVALDDTYIIVTQATYHFDNFDLKYIGGGTNYHFTQITDNGPGTAVSSFTINPAPFNPLLPATTSSQPCALSNTFVKPGSCAGLNVFPNQSQTYEENFHNFSHELDFASSGNGPLQWLGGLYYYEEGIQQPVFQTLPQQTQLAGPIMSLPGTAAVPLDFQNRTYDDRPDIHDQSYAVFGQVDYKFTDTLKATLGLRWSHDREYGSESLRTVCFATFACGSTPQTFGQFSFPIDVTPATANTSGVPLGVVANGHPGGVIFSPDGFATRDYNITSSATTGTAGLTWTPDKDTMAYFTYSRGYKQAGLFVGAGSSLGTNAATNPEHLDDYELGLKKDFGRTLQTNLALFYYNYEGLQAPLTVPNNTGAVTSSQNEFLNIPSSYSEGVEFESTWVPIDNLRILFNYSFNPTGINKLTGVIDPQDPEGLAAGASPIGALTKCTSTNPAAVGGNALCDVNTGFVERFQNLKGNVLPNAARNKVAVNVLYTWDFQPGSLTPSVSYVWRDKEYASIFKRDYDSSPEWGQADARITWKDKDNRYSVIAFVKNMFDTLGYDSAASGTRNTGVYALSTVAAAPGLITPGLVSQPGLSVNGLATGIGANGISRNYALTPPRTFGVEFQYRF